MLEWYSLFTDGGIFVDDDEYTVRRNGFKTPGTVAASCRRQISAEDPNTWLEAKRVDVCEKLQPTATDDTCSRSELSYHKWWQLLLQLRPWDKAVILKIEKFTLPRQETWQGKTKVMSKLIIFVDIKSIVYREFVPGDQTVMSALYSDLLRQWRKCTKTSSRTLARKRLLHLVSHTFVHHGLFDQY